MCLFYVTRMPGDEMKEDTANILIARESVINRSSLKVSNLPSLKNTNFDQYLLITSQL